MIYTASSQLYCIIISLALSTCTVH